MSTHTDTGGPAFPELKIVTINGDFHSDDPGMTLRDYFAARAPQVPDWFKHTATSPRPVLFDVPADFTTVERAELSRLLSGDADPTSYTRVTDFLDSCFKERQKINEWRDQQRELKFFAWRWHYADQMIAARGK